MNGPILPTSRWHSSSFNTQHADITLFLRILGVWELALDSLCAREREEYCVQLKRARVLRFYLPILPKEEERTKIQEVMSLVSMGSNGSMGGCYA